jgi:hypothetical protein
MILNEIKILLNKIADWKITFLLIPILAFVISIYLHNIPIISAIGSTLSIICIFCIIIAILGIVFIKCDTTWPEWVPHFGGKFIDRKSMLFEICDNDGDCCDSYNMDLRCEGYSKSVPKICTPAKYNCNTDGGGYNRCETGKTTIIDKNDPGKPILVGSFGELARSTLDVLGPTAGALIGAKYGKGIKSTAGGYEGGKLIGDTIASMIPGGGEGPLDKGYWTGEGTDFDKITINVDGTYDTVQDCKKTCKTTLDSYKQSNFYKCIDVAKQKGCGGPFQGATDEEKIKNCTHCISDKQEQIIRCQPSGKKGKTFGDPCLKDDIWCGIGEEGTETWCKNIVKNQSDESIQKMIDCPTKLLDNGICATNKALIGNIHNCISCIDENIKRVEGVGCPINMNRRDKINLCNQMSYNYNI